ncbi:MAG: heme ABC exporter ATP-binding protein CcmA [Gemmatimonadota bacterium]
MPPPAADGLVEVQDLWRAFGTLEVLRGVSLSVGAGELTLIVGPNGAGKSTLLRSIAGLARPTKGEVRIAGRPVRTDAEARRLIGFLSHQTLLYPDLTPVENLAFVARLYGLPHPVVLATAELRDAGLGQWLDIPVRLLSRGTVQRVAIVRALLHRPKVLLLDEPFTGLDAPSADRLRDLLRRAVMDGVAVLLVSHDLHDVWPLATRTAVLHRGLLHGDGEARSVEAFEQRYREVLRD